MFVTAKVSFLFRAPPYNVQCEIQAVSNPVSHTDTSRKCPGVDNDVCDS